MRTICILVLALAPEAARGADRADPVAGEALFREGRRLLKAGDLAGACAKLDESHRLDPAVGTLANLADCEERLGRLASAWQHWRWVADQLSASDRRRATALARAGALDKRVPRLTVEVADAETAQVTVERDGVALGRASWGVALPLDPGSHRIVVRAPGRKPLTYDVAVTEGEQRRLQVAAGPAGDITPPPIAATAAQPPPADLAAHAAATPAPPRWRRRAGYTLLGAGAVGLGAGAYFAVEALGARSDARRACPGAAQPPTCWSSAGLPLARDRYFSRMADASLLAGAVAAAAGGYLLYTGRSRALSVAALPASGGAEVAVAARF